MVADEQVEPVVGDDRAHRMNARPAVLADRRQISEADLELVDEGAPGFGHLRFLSCKFAPALHRSTQQTRAVAVIQPSDSNPLSCDRYQLLVSRTTTVRR